MTKHRPDPDTMANELAGASAFFRPAAPTPVSETSSQSPASASATPTTPEPKPSNDVMTSQRHDVTTSDSGEPAAFDITRETASRDSLRLSIDETKALDAMRASLKWDYDLTVSKNDICRVALHMLLEEFAARGERSQAVGRLKKKTSDR